MGSCFHYLKSTVVVVSSMMLFACDGLEDLAALEEEGGQHPGDITQQLLGTWKRPCRQDGSEWLKESVVFEHGSLRAEMKGFDQPECGGTESWNLVVTWDRQHARWLGEGQEDPSPEVEHQFALDLTLKEVELTPHTEGKTLEMTINKICGKSDWVNHQIEIVTELDCSPFFVPPDTGLRFELLEFRNNTVVFGAELFQIGAEKEDDRPSKGLENAIFTKS